MDGQTISVLIGFVGAIVGIWKIARDFRDDLDKTVKLLFKRFDDHKTDTDAKLIIYQDAGDLKYQRKDMCMQIHGGTERALQQVCTEIQGLRADLKELERERRVRDGQDH